MLIGHVSRAEDGNKAMSRGYEGIAYRLRRPLRWGPVKQEFVGDDEANRICARAMREQTLLCLLLGWGIIKRFHRSKNLTNESSFRASCERIRRG